ncbi:MAG: triose-phosphate isomerase [Bacteriovoracaceae bacterium]|nr:triose-phosphate isomerase [Bacteriovoracaceae bacterium]
MTRKIHIVGNWKMNKKMDDIKTFFEEFSKLKDDFNCNSWIAPQHIHIPIVREFADSFGIAVGAQNCSHKTSGAFTGDISAESLKDLGTQFTLVGHSERRAFFGETHAILNEKTHKALEYDLSVIFCIGETLEQREASKTEDVVKEQLKEGLKNFPNEKLSKLIVAYEPVWAIGTGKTATPEQAEDVHKVIRDYLTDELKMKGDEIVLLYGGSVKPGNIKELLSMPNIDGALVGGASLQASDFAALCKAS